MIKERDEGLEYKLRCDTCKKPIRKKQPFEVTETGEIHCRSHYVGGCAFVRGVGG